MGMIFVLMALGLIVCIFADWIDSINKKNN